MVTDGWPSKVQSNQPDRPSVTNVACSLSSSLFTAPVPETELADKFVKHFLRGLWRAKSNQPTSKTVVVAAGPCATGRTAVGTTIANEANVPFIEGASLHTEAAVANMRADIAVTEDHRMAWLDRVIRRTAEVSPSLATAKSL